MREPRDVAARAFEAAVEAEQVGDLKSAAAAIRHAILLDPSDPKWHGRLGILLHRLEDWTGAADAMAEATRLHPVRPARFVRLGWIRERVWDLPGAIDAYTKAVTMCPDRESWLARLEGVRRKAETFQPFRGLVVAHRGRAAGRPENAVASSYDLPRWVAGVEIDVRLSGDGVPVLMHDRDLRRTTGREGDVASMSLTKLRRLSGDVEVSTLEDYLRACTRRNFRLILIDIKLPTISTIEAVASVVTDSRMAERCVVMVRNETAMSDVRRASEGLRIGLFGTKHSNVANRIAAANAYGAELLLIDHGDGPYLRHRGVVQKVQRAGLLAGASTINSWRALEAARTDRCDLLLTDKAEQLRHFTSYASDRQNQDNSYV